MVCSVTMVSIRNFAKQINNFAIYYLENLPFGIKIAKVVSKLQEILYLTLWKFAKELFKILEMATDDSIIWLKYLCSINLFVKTDSVALKQHGLIWGAQYVYTIEYMSRCNDQKVPFHLSQVIRGQTCSFPATDIS